jgi:hypothetical protein
MGMTKRILEDIINEDIYPCDMDYDYQQWVINKQLEDQQKYIQNYMETKAAYQEMLADKY